MSTLDLLELANAGWPALETVEVDGWIARLSHGVTKRANSVWPRSEAKDAAASIERVESLYRERGLRPAFQLTDADAALQAMLGERGYDVVDETLVMSAPLASAPRASARSAECVEMRRVEHGAALRSARSLSLGRVTSEACAEGEITIETAPSAEWLHTWWAVDGRGGDAERDVARRIMCGGEALYATLCDVTGVACVARLALVEGRGGVYALATRADARRRGHARRVVAALIAAAAQRGVTGLWLQVIAGNVGAITLYRSLGFTPAGAYRYLLAPSASATR